MLDLLLTGGIVVDGSGSPAVPADVAVERGRIVHVGPLEPGTTAADVVDCSGLVVAPGFIDIHSHSDDLLLLNRTADSKITQGVTTEVGGNCGFSPAPLLGPHLAEEFERHLVDLGISERWTTLAEFYDALEGAGTAVNFASFTGHGNLRKAVVGLEARPATPDEIAAMRRLLEEAVEQGSFGLSTGLIYPPGCYAAIDEIVALTEAGVAGGGFYATHMRDEGNHLEDAVDEALEIGRRAASQVQISHHKACGNANWGKVERTLASIDRAIDLGIPVFADQYPYLATSTGLSALLPKWVHDGGRDAVVARLEDPDTAAVIREEIEHGPSSTRHSGRWESVVVTQVRTEANEWVEGKSIREISESWSVDPITALFRLLIEEKLGAGMVNFLLCDADVETVMRHPRVCIGSDGTAKSLTGPLSRGKPHPRAYGTFPRVLSEYVRERRTLGLEEAVRKMTGLTAAILGLRDRGLVAPGFAADLVAFDPVRVRDRATFVDPHAFSDGIAHVYVNGASVVENGAITGATPGVVLRNDRS